MIIFQNLKQIKKTTNPIYISIQLYNYLFCFFIISTCIITYLLAYLFQEAMKMTKEDDYHPKITKNINPNAFKLDVEQACSKYITFVRTKLFKEIGKPVQSCKGSGVMIDSRYVLTACHNFNQYFKIIENHKIIDKDQKHPLLDHSYIKRGLFNGQDKGKYHIKSIHCSKRYFDKSIDQKQRAMFDYAIVEVVPFNQQQIQKKDQKYPALLALTEKTYKTIKTISVYGYPIEANSKFNEQSDNFFLSLSEKQKKEHSSMFITNQYGAEGPVQELNIQKITYKIPTDKGVSGTGIFTQYKDDLVVIGIHKGSTKQMQSLKHQQKNPLNIGVCCGLMLQELNELGYMLRKKPFVYTERTLRLRKKQDSIKDKQTLNLSDKKYCDLDVLVITAFDLSKTKRIVISGNKISRKGLQFLMRRSYPALKSLFLTHNQIGSIQNIDKQLWENISNIQTLSLSLNKLTTIPMQLLILKRLDKLWLAYNRMQIFPQALVQYCKVETNGFDHKEGYDRQRFKVLFVYGNQFAKISSFVAGLKETKTNIVWTRQEMEEYRNKQSEEQM